jgi:heme/copper-type cytochrome/quinol oxidase subunit 3
MKGFQESTLHSSTDTTHLGGCLGLYLYWHFVDFVWLTLLGTLYIGSLNS